MSAPKRLFKCCVLWCTNEHGSLHWLPPSELRTLWLSFIVWENVLEKIGKVPNTCRNQYQRFVRERQLQTKYVTHLQIAFLWKSFLALCKTNDAKVTIVLVFTGAVFMNDCE